IATGLREHKFGLEVAVARRLYLGSRGGKQARWLEAAGIGFHIGSQIVDLAPFTAAARRVAELASELASQGVRLKYFDAGGGLGVAYGPGQRVPSVAASARALRRGRRGGVAYSARTRAAAAGGGGRAADARALRQAPRRPDVCDHRRRRQRPAAPEPVRRVPRDCAAASAARAQAARGRGGAAVRKRRQLRVPAPAAADRGRR